MSDKPQSTLPLIPFQTMSIAPALSIQMGIVYCTHRLQTGHVYYSTVYTDTPINLDIPEVAEQDMLAALQWSNVAVDHMIRYLHNIRIL